MAAPVEVRMSRRIALVTGSARGIGLAIAEALAAADHDVVGVDVLPHGDDFPGRGLVAASLKRWSITSRHGSSRSCRANWIPSTVPRCW